LDVIDWDVRQMVVEVLHNLLLNGDCEQWAVHLQFQMDQGTGSVQVHGVVRDGEEYGGGGAVGGDDEAIRLALARPNCEAEDGRRVAVAYAVDLLADPFRHLRTPFPKHPSFRYLCRVHFSFDPSLSS